jgi:hypothetical protein
MRFGTTSRRVLITVTIWAAGTLGAGLVIGYALLTTAVPS